MSNSFEHCSCLVFPFALKDQSSRSQFLKTAGNGSWSCEEYRCHPDLHLAVRSLFGLGGGADENAKGIYWLMNESAQKSLSEKQRDMIHQDIHFNKRAIRRLSRLLNESDDSIRALTKSHFVKIEKIELHLFSDNIGFFVVTITYEFDRLLRNANISGNAQLLFDLLMECNYTIAHNAPFKQNFPTSLPQQIANEIALSFGAHKSESNSSHPWRRRALVYTFASINSNELAESEAKLYAARLSRLLSNDYSDSDAFDWPIFNPVGSVFHSASRDGAALVVRKTGVPFLDGFKQTGFEEAYYPIYLLISHEKILLATIAEDAADNSLMSARLGKAAKLIEILQYRLLSYRLFSRFTHLSDTENHEAFATYFRKQLALGSIESEVSRDIEQAVRYIDQKMRRRQDARMFVLSAIGGVFGADWLFEALFGHSIKDMAKILIPIWIETLSMWI